MDVMTVIKGRRSIRAYTDEPVTKEKLTQLIEAAVWAPNGGNSQTWRFVVITDDKVMKKIKMVSPGLLGSPPSVIVIAQDLLLAKHKGGNLGPESISKMDSAMAAQNIMLTAYEMGLGTCVIASFHAKSVGRLLKLPEHILPHLIVSVGSPAKTPSPPSRRFNEIFWFEEYNG